jgi:uncharacterized membrane protein
MAIGPVQLLVLGFVEPEFKGEVIAELDRLKESDTVRVIDGLVIHKNEKGEIKKLRRSDLSEEESAEFGAVVGALIGLGAAGMEGAKAGAEAGATAALEDFEPLGDEEMWEVLEDIPENTAAAIVMLEHRWAIPLRDAIRNANGYPLADGWVRPEQLVAIGMLAAEEAEELALAK